MSICALAFSLVSLVETGPDRAGSVNQDLSEAAAMGVVAAACPGDDRATNGGIQSGSRSSCDVVLQALLSLHAWEDLLHTPYGTGIDLLIVGTCGGIFGVILIIIIR